MTSTKTGARSRWTMIPTADLAAVAGTLPEADADLVAAAKAGGFADPLYVIEASTGLRIVDGMRRLAAAVAAELAEVPTTDRPVIRLSLLTAHPGNVRKNLNITAEMRASIEEEGIVTALTLTRDPNVEGGIQVIDGHRRLATGLAVGETHAPYQWQGDIDEASKYLAMVTTARHREALTSAEEAAALFSAVELGAKISRAAKAAGITVKDARRVVKAGSSQAVARVGTTTELSLDDMDRLAELEAEPETLASVEEAIARSPKYAAHHIELGMKTLNAHRAAAAQRAELDAAGARIRDRDEMGERAFPIKSLTKVNADEHATQCKGAAWVLESPNAPEYTQWCTQVVLYGHATEEQINPKAAKKTADPEASAALKNTKAGNIAWDAAESVRRRWLADYLAKPASRDHQAIMQELVTLHLLTQTEVWRHTSKGKAHDILGPLLGKAETYDRKKLAGDVAKASGPRRTVMTFAVLASAFECYMDRAAWRPEATFSHIYRPTAASWLTLLTTLGYQPAPIEEATRDGLAYDAIKQEPVKAPAARKARTAKPADQGDQK